MILPDASIWIAYRRQGCPGITRAMDRALERHEVLACGPILARLTLGAEADDLPSLLGTLEGLPWADLDRHAWREVARLAQELRGGSRPLPLTDLEIAMTALSAGATLWTADRRYQRIAGLRPALDLRLAL